jgi:hypothetical protein
MGGGSTELAQWERIAAVIPEEDVLLFVILITFFCVFSPKITCQVPKPHNSLKAKEIEFAL